jgi:UDP-N-acetyl-D-mannosaminuronic acid dehydrogenase/UDP-N-acetyl-D-glucosamine dehydrogenase
MRFTPGPGVGGNCLPVDPTYLSWQARRDLNRSFRFVPLANDINHHIPEYVLQRLTTLLKRQRKPLQDGVIVLLGMSYKPNTGDIRESPVLRVIELLNEVDAVAHVVDSHVEQHQCPPGMKLIGLSEQNLRPQADAVVLLTDHDDVDYELVESVSSCVLDTRHRLSDRHVEYL